MERKRRLANEIYATYEEGNTLYALVWKGSTVCTVTAGTFAAYSDASIDAYDVVLTNHVDSDFYTADFPAAITDTAQQAYRIQVFLQVGGSIDADADICIAHGEIHWNGTGEVSIGTINITNTTVTNTYDEVSVPGSTVIDETIRI